MERYICIHGHFYQPPRENPWLETIEVQDSAHPYHDWNQRITAECYAPNSASRILDAQGRITAIVNNYAHISFNFGPTLLAWMERHAPATYQAILDADAQGRKTFSGHGPAIAQAYNHIILPLATRRDKETQIIWGIRDFYHRFRRPPEGMWLPETAVDTETLAILAEQGIRFTLLAPHQARRFRRADGPWQDCNGGIDPTTPYQVHLPSGRTIAVFFYDGSIAHAVAFQDLLHNGEAFVQRLVSAFREGRPWPQIVHIATDGETYGHHRPHGDMALAYALHALRSRRLARLTVYGEYLSRHPPAYHVEIVENSSWSCAHGVQRWRTACGCHTGRHPEWSQAWRAPLREAMDWLRDTLAPLYEEAAARLVRDPWAARNDYITIILDRSPEVWQAFLSQHARRPLSLHEQVTLRKLLELQRHTLLMYTSCGWFFDDISGLETVQVLQYAARALQLGEDLFQRPLEPDFLRILERAKSNLAEHGDGRRVYERFVRPAMVDLKRVGAHYAVSALFESYPPQTTVYSYSVEQEDLQTLSMGESRLAIGRLKVTSQVTLESARLCSAVVHFGGHNLVGGVRELRDEEAHPLHTEELTHAFLRADIPAVLSLLEQHYTAATYSLHSLFRDEQRRIIARILQATVDEAETVYRQLYQRHQPLMRYLVSLGYPLPRALHRAAEVALNADLRRALNGNGLDWARLTTLVQEAQTWQVGLDRETLAHLLREALERLMERLADSPDDIPLLKHVKDGVAVARTLPFAPDLWKLQNTYYTLLQHVYPDYQRRAQQGEGEAKVWLDLFTALGGLLAVRVP
ncbi:MAG: DUF3536 domain-containing protein [Dehalococcoidia bacterium]|nr:DUF3536 domain-containing protein [Dehalococcoidia bacterium]MDW8119786.1 DUF3536 domain-containing protein [Chloroflexota bacterium]